MERSIVDALNTARNNTVSVILDSGGDPVATALAKAEQDKLQGFKALFDSLLKG